MPTPGFLDYLFALNLTPEKAIEYFKSKGFEFSWNWREVFEAQHNIAFTVAKVMKENLLKDIRAIVEDYISGELDYRLAYKNLAADLQRKGWWGKQYQINPHTGKEELVQLGSPRRIKTILDTNLNVSLAAGEMRTQLDQASIAPYWQYKTQDDERVRAKHDEIGNVFINAVLRYDHPFWQIWYPPNDWGCRCFVKTYRESDLEKYNLKILSDEDLSGIPEPAEGWRHSPLSGIEA